MSTKWFVQVNVLALHVLRRLEMPVIAVAVRRRSGEQLEGLHRLVDRHAGAGSVRQPSARARCRARFGREIDDVGDPVARREQLGANGMPGYFAMPTGVALTSPSALRDRGCRCCATVDARAEAVVQRRRQVSRPDFVGVEDRRALRRRARAAHGRPPRRAPPAPNWSDIRARSRPSLAKALGKAPAVGIVPDRAPARRRRRC